MREVVVTGYGIVSCLGNDIGAVTESLKNSNSGITINEINKELGLRSHISGSITDLNLKEKIDRKLYRFMGDAAAFAYLSAEEAIENANLSNEVLVDQSDKSLEKMKNSLNELLDNFTKNQINSLNENTDDLKKEIPNLDYYDCKNFLEAAEIIKSSKFFIGNSSFGFTIAEGLKVPRVMESYPDFPVIYEPNLR